MKYLIVVQKASHDDPHDVEEKHFGPTNADSIEDLLDMFGEKHLVPEDKWDSMDVYVYELGEPVRFSKEDMEGYFE